MIADFVCAEQTLGNDVKVSTFHKLLRTKILQQKFCPDWVDMVEENGGAINPRRWYALSEHSAGRLWAT